MNKFIKTKRVGEQIADKSAKGIAKVIWSLQSRFAKEMNTYAEKLSTMQKKIALISFLIFGMTYSTMLLYQGIYPNRKKTPFTPAIIHSTMPQNIDLPDSLNLYLLRQYKILADSFNRKKDTTHP